MSAQVEARCRQHDSVVDVQYNWNNEGFTSSSTFDASTEQGESALSLQVKAIDGDSQEYTITLESLNFLWQNPVIIQDDCYENGQKGGIVEMFGWSHEDIEEECEAIAQMGWMGVKVFPTMESVMSDEWP